MLGFDSPCGYKFNLLLIFSERSYKESENEIKVINKDKKTPMTGWVKRSVASDRREQGVRLVV